MRRLALGAGLAIAGGILGVLAMSTAAHADDGTQRPGGALGAVVEAVDQATPEPTKAPEPDPTREPEPAEEAPAEPEPSDEPTRGADGQDEQESSDEPAEESAPANPIEAVTDPVEPVVEPVVEVVEVVTAPVVPTPTPAPVVVVTPPVVVPPAVTTPAPVQPTTPTPTTDDTTTAPAPTAEPQVPAAAELPVAAADELPVVIGPIAGTGTLLPGFTPDLPDGSELGAPHAPECTGEQPADAAPDHGRGVLRTITDRRTGLPAAQQPPAPLTPCPQPAPPTDQAVTAGAVKPPPPTGEQLVADSAAGLGSDPALARLAQLRPRSHMPAGRSEHIDPRPA